MSKLLRTAAVVASLCTAGAASAATVDFSGSTGQSSSFNYSIGGVGITVTGERFSCGLFSGCGVRPAIVTRDGTGLGVTGGFDTDNDLDGQFDEFITFSFSQAINLQEVLFSDVDDNDDWDIWVDGTQVGFDSDMNAFSFGGLSGSTLTIGADGFNDSFRVNTLTASVPLPAAGLLMLGALGGVGALRRRKKSA